MNEEMMTAGTGGFSGSATATGPNAGFDPVLRMRAKRKALKGLVAPGNKLSDGKKKVKESVTAVNKLAPKSHLFQYKVSLPEIGSTVVYASNPAELRQKLRLLINYRYRGDITIERILPGDAGKFFMDKRQKHLKNVKESADQAIKQQMTRQQIGLEKQKSNQKIVQIRKELQKKTASLMKKQRAGGAQATVDK